MSDNLSNSSTDAVFPADLALAFRLRFSVRMLDLAVVEATSCESRLRRFPINCKIEKIHVKLGIRKRFGEITCQLLDKTENRAGRVGQVIVAVLGIIIARLQATPKSKSY